MAVTILSNKPNGSVTIHVTNANAALVIAGNTSVSNVAASGEILTGATIRKVWWGIDNAGSIQIARGGAGAANNVLVLSQSGFMDFAAGGTVINVNKTANVAISFAGSANGFAIIELKKEGTMPDERFQP